MRGMHVHINSLWLLLILGAVFRHAWRVMHTLDCLSVWNQIRSMLRPLCRLCACIVMVKLSY